MVSHALNDHLVSALFSTNASNRQTPALVQVATMGLSAAPFYLLIPAFVLLHLAVAPYTKVEESFNLQAIHDILIHGIPSENADQFFAANYDHVSFPGSVPRTFAGALVLSGLSRPWVMLMGSTAQLQMLGKFGMVGVLGWVD
jgi:alpha-1,6-mannosyltransferase